MFEATTADQEKHLIKAKTTEMYVFTAQAMAEAALCLRYDIDQLPMKGGHATPAAALGLPYLNRLENNKIMIFESC